MKEQRHKDGKKECMVCRNFILDEDSLFDICEICGWKNDELALEKPYNLVEFLIGRRTALSNNNT